MYSLIFSQALHLHCVLNWCITKIEKRKQKRECRTSIHLACSRPSFELQHKLWLQHGRGTYSGGSTIGTPVVSDNGMTYVPVADSEGEWVTRVVCS